MVLTKAELPAGKHVKNVYSVTLYCLSTLLLLNKNKDTTKILKKNKTVLRREY